MFTYKKENNLPIKSWIPKEDYFADEKMVEQVENLSRLPFAFHHVALSPDGHVGYGMPIGGVLATQGVVIPNAVGKDIGCGMCAVKTNLTELDKDMLKKIMGEIREVIPVGFEHNKEACDENLMPLINTLDSNMLHASLKLKGFPIISREYQNARKSLGTLGGGNHFIEIQKGSDGYIWIMIHSGSRNLGKQVADYYNKLAIQLNAKWHSSIPKKWELAFLPLDSKEGEDYLREMQYCVDFASKNRCIMLEKIINIFMDITKCDLKLAIEKADNLLGYKGFVNVAHNYAKMENHFFQNVMVHRKGATLASDKTYGIIPGSQGSKSYIVKGKGNAESFFSCSHGAGRKMGRKDAIRFLNLQDEIKKLNDLGVIHAIRTQQDLEEAPSAYKDIVDVMKNQKDLVEILVELTPLAVIKA